MLYLHGLGHFHPANCITNAFLEELDIGTNNEWIMERVGIACRRTILPLDYIRATRNQDLRETSRAALFTNAKTGAAAARMALARAGISAREVGLVISGSSCPEYVSPAEAAAIAAELEIEAPVLDMNNACTTFGTQINSLSAARPKALPPFILLVNPENLTRSIDFNDRNSAVLFGDCSVAAVVSTRVASDKKIRLAQLGARPSQWPRVVIPRTDFFRQDGNQVQRFAILKTSELLERLLKTIRRGGGRIIFIAHQANRVMLEHVCERAKVSPENHWFNVDLFGNTASAGAPSVLSQRWEDLRPGDQIAMMQVGAGLTWASWVVSVSEVA